ncbi:DUF1588 domain-containing protein [Akkermansiaceae bacterium]|nr:DUF1588 domain-containing protein [Akkermansiaceae bacterium]
MKPFFLLILLSSHSFGEENDLLEFKEWIKPFLSENCVRCHGEKKQKADFTVHDIDGLITNGKDVERWEKILEMVSLGDMPPEDENQPSEVEKSRAQGWIAGELAKIGRGHDPSKLALPHQANRVDHDDLFSGEFKGPAFSPPRMWRKSPQIYSRFASEMRVKLSQPLLGLGGKGIQDYASLVADESTIKTMMRNSNLVAEHMVSPERSHINRFLNGFFKEGAEPPTEEGVERALVELFKQIYQREPTPEDRTRYIEGLFEKNRQLGGLSLGFRSLIMGILMSQEFVFRMEVGLGEELPDGRRRLSPLELAYSLSYALYDKPDPELLKAAREGRLQSRQDVGREVRKSFENPDDEKRYWNYPMYHRWGEDYYHFRPRELRFFQEFFGYPAVADVFKDRERAGFHHANRLRKDADMFVLGILEKDQDVFGQLLTSNHYPMDYLKDVKPIQKLQENPDERHNKHLREQYGEVEWASILKSGKWPGIRSNHVEAYNLDRDAARAIRRVPGESVVFPRAQRAGMLTHPAWLVAHSANTENDPIRRGKWIREHLLADLVPEVPIGVDAKVPEDPQRTLRQRMGKVRPEECWRCHRQMNPLGEVFESYDDFGRFREVIVLGDAEEFFKKRRKFVNERQRTKDELKRWLKLDRNGRQKKVGEAEAKLAEIEKPNEGVKNYPAVLSRYEKDFKRWTGERKKWQEMTDQEWQKEVNRYRQRLTELGEPVPEVSVPVDTSGELRGTGNPALDGPVEDAIDLVNRLAKSERVRQSFVRHAFRFWMGRNETLNDSPTLIAADRAYTENGGSFKALLVSLLTSDSFLYRKELNPEN